MIIDDVTLSELKVDQIELVRQWRNSPEVRKFMYTETEITPEQQASWFASVSEDPTKKYWMIEVADQPMGVANLSNIDLNHSRAEWAFYLGDTTTRGRGLGSKVEFLVLEYVFDRLGLNKLCGEVLAFNKAVLSLHKKFGFVKEGLRRQHAWKNGQFEDIVEIALFRNEWNKRKADLRARIQSYASHKS